MKIKFSTKASIYYLLTTGIIILLMGISVFFIFKKQRLQLIDQELSDYSYILTENVYVDNRSISTIYNALQNKKLLTKSKLSNQYQIVLTDNDSIIYESNNVIIPDSLIQPVIAKFSDKKKYDFINISFRNKDFRTFSRKLKILDKDDLELILIASLDRYQDNVKILAYILFILSPFFILLSALIGYFITKRTFAPINKLIHTIEEISVENLNIKITVPDSNDEIATLAMSFNNMIDRLNQMFQAQKQFISDASHDIKTPLSVILLEADLLLNNKNLDENQKKSLLQIRHSIKRLIKLTEELLLLAKYDANQLVLRKETVRLDELILEIVSELNILAKEKNITFNIDIKDPIEFNLDKNLFSRAILNTIDNAIKYSFPDTQIRIKLSKKDKNSVEFKVINQGESLSGEKLKNIFNRFSMGDESRHQSGFGLGMPIIQTICDAHKFKINFQSDKNINIFIILLKK